MTAVRVVMKPASSATLTDVQATLQMVDRNLTQYVPAPDPPAIPGLPETPQVWVHSEQPSAGSASWVNLGTLGSVWDFALIDATAVSLVAAERAGRQVVRFDGFGPPYRTGAIPTVSRISGNKTVYMVWRLREQRANWWAVRGDVAQLIVRGGTTPFHRISDGTASASRSELPPLTWRYDTALVGGGELHWWLNGANLLSVTGSDQSLAQTSLGYNAASGSFDPAPMDLAEFMVFEGMHNPATRTVVWDYLRERWAF
jgi:hypothetical protein